MYAPQRFGVATPKPAPQRGFGAATAVAWCVTSIQGARGHPVCLGLPPAGLRLRDQWMPSPRVANQFVWPRERR